MATTARSASRDNGQNPQSVAKLSTCPQWEVARGGCAVGRWWSEVSDREHGAPVQPTGSPDWGAVGTDPLIRVPSVPMTDFSNADWNRLWNVWENGSGLQTTPVFLTLPRRTDAARFATAR